MSLSDSVSPRPTLNPYESQICSVFCKADNRKDDQRTSRHEIKNFIHEFQLLIVHFNKFILFKWIIQVRIIGGFNV